MKIGLLFGSFNPIHIGHLIVATYFTNYLVDKVWFVMSPQNPFKDKNELLDASCRLELVQLAIVDNENFLVTNIEFDLPKPSFTINTLNQLSQQNPTEEFYIIMGSDNLSQLPTWKSSDEIIENYKILVYERSGFPFPINTDHQNIHLYKTPFINLSSTSIRNLIAKNKSIRYLVPEKVYEEIIIKGYFK
jgi:nicotinate-nucleotide adenylyltransferase